ncbi:MAG: MBL fold metallo-hydrolase [Deltaproteobacteria bacterium]|nr:MBL fold metallo-hydrolase [Deltaproteobacteria bacterium]
MTQLFIRQLAVGPMQNFAYLVGDAQAKKVAVVDPGWDADTIFAEAKGAGVEIVAVLITHTHFDHIKAIEKLLNHAPVPVYVHRLEVGQLPRISNIVTTDEGTTMTIGSLTVRCHHTPGHSPGCQCFDVGAVREPPLLFTGDTLFIDACGRTDLPGSDPNAMHRSLKRLAHFPPETIVYPGHDYGPTPTATIGEQLKTNSFLREAAGS